MNLDDWLKIDPRRSLNAFYSRMCADYVCQVRDPGGVPAIHELHGDTKAEAIENARERLGLDP